MNIVSLKIKINYCQENQKCPETLQFIYERNLSATSLWWCFFNHRRHRCGNHWNRAESGSPHYSISLNLRLPIVRIIIIYIPLRKKKGSAAIKLQDNALLQFLFFFKRKGKIEELLFLFGYLILVISET